ncbi:MAG: hypothetical protein RLZZ28_506 [Bacteroidota bacterium]|jgi:hypothetical protein
MKKLFLFTGLLLVTVHFSFAQAVEKDTTKEKTSHVPQINLLLRTELQSPLSSGKQASATLPESRFEVMGKIVPNLEYRIRYRLNGNFNGNSLDNTPGSLDIAYINYRFGKENKFTLTAGKQAAFAASWEFDNNPTFEYQYSEHVNAQLTLFLLAMKLGYQVNENHAFYIQVHNTVNNRFADHLAKNGYVPNGLEGAKYPMGIYLGWMGALFNNKLNTFWSYNISQFAKGKTNHSFAFGNKFNLNKFSAYLDISYTDYGLDHPGIASHAISDMNGSSSFAEDISYTTAVLRADYNFLPKWFLTTKGFYENAVGNRQSFNRKNTGFLIGIEHKPFQSQAMKLFAYYYLNEQKARLNSLESKNSFSLFSVGVLYFLNALK